MKNNGRARNFVLIFFLLALTFGFAERSITDFRIPPSSALSAQIGLLGGFYQWSKLDRKVTGYLGRFQFGLEGFSENDDKALAGDLSLTFRPSYYRDEGNDSIENRFYGNTGICQNLSALTYINSTGWFTGLEAEGEVDWDYTQYTEKKYEHYISGYFGGGFDAGYGRLRDGTNLWKALEIERILKEEEVIYDDLASDDILAVAQTVNQLQRFAISHERFEKYYYQELEVLFQELGIDRVPAFVWFKIKEVIDYEVIPRRFGYRVGIGPYIEGDGSYSYYQYEDYGYDIKYGRSFIFGQITFNSAYPLTKRLQLDQGALVRANDQDLNVKIGLTLDYRVSLRIDLDLTNSFEYQSPSLNYDRKFIFHDHELGFRYYLEDDMYFNGWCGYHRIWQDEGAKLYPGFDAGVAFSYYVW